MAGRSEPWRSHTYQGEKPRVGFVVNQQKAMIKTDVFEILVLVAITQQ